MRLRAAADPARRGTVPAGLPVGRGRSRCPTSATDERFPRFASAAPAAGLAARLHLPAALRRRPARRPRPVPRRHRATSTPARHGGRADAGRRRRGLPAERAGQGATQHDLGPVSAQRAARRADRAAEPAAAAATARARRAARQALAHERGGAVRRPRPVQAGQRHPRPPGRRRAAARGRATGCRRCVRPGTRSPGSPATSSCSCARTCRRGRRRGARRARSTARSSSRSPSAASSSRSRRASGWRSPVRGRTSPTSCCVDADIAMYQAKRKGGGRPPDLRPARRAPSRRARQPRARPARGARPTDELDARVPADRAQRGRLDHRRRGAAALEPPGARAGAAGDDHRGRRAERPDRRRSARGCSSAAAATAPRWLRNRPGRRWTWRSTSRPAS